MVRNTYGEQKLTIEQMHPNRKLAAETGHKHYFTGKTCKHGHIAPRMTRNATCVICNREHTKSSVRRKNCK